MRNIAGLCHAKLAQCAIADLRSGTRSHGPASQRLQIVVAVAVYQLVVGVDADMAGFFVDDQL